MTHTADAPTTTTRVPVTLRALQVTAVLTVVNLAFQFVTAGELFPDGGPEGLHANAAIVLHVVSGLTSIAAGLHMRATRGPWWPTALAFVVFALSFVQAYYGGRSTLWIHIPGAMVLTIGAVWVLAWSFSGAARRGTA